MVNQAEMGCFATMAMIHIRITDEEKKTRFNQLFVDLIRRASDHGASSNTKNLLQIQSK